MKDWVKKRKSRILITFLLLVVGILSYLLNYESKIYNHLSLPFYHYFEYADSYVSIDGTWATESGEEELANELQTVRFTCIKEKGTCQQIVADTVFDILSIYTEESVITGWDNNFITFETESDATSCVSYKYRIDRLKKELVGVRETIKYDGLCEGMSSKDMNLKLIDGFKVISELRGYKYK